MSIFKLCGAQAPTINIFCKMITFHFEYALKMRIDLNRPQYHANRVDFTEFCSRVDTYSYSKLQLILGF